MSWVDIGRRRPHIEIMADLPERLVLYDGVCGLCDRTVQWLLERDPEGRLSFAPLESETAQTILARHPEIPDGIDSIVFVENAGEGAEEWVTWRSRGVFRIVSHLPGRWRFAAWLRVIPAFISDLVYRLVARIRYRIWGRLDECRVPTQSEKARFYS